MACVTAPGGVLLDSRDGEYQLPLAFLRRNALLSRAACRWGFSASLIMAPKSAAFHSSAFRPRPLDHADGFLPNFLGRMT